MSKIRWGGKQFAMLLFRVEGGAIIFEGQRLVRPDRRGKVSTAGVFRIGASPKLDEQRVPFVLSHYPASHAWIDGIRKAIEELAAAPNALTTLTLEKSLFSKRG
jgi:hypothetical protein